MRQCAAALALFVVALSGCAPAENTPNLLVITLDTTRADHFGFAGYEGASTPNFDAFAAERAVSFENAISAVPITLPSHATIMTGTFPVFHGIHDNDGYFLDEEVTTLAEILATEGFTTGAVLGAYPLDSEVNLDQGFQTYDDDYQSDWTAAERAARGPLSFGFLERKADRVNMAVNRWLEKNSEERFFLWVHYFDPHQPYNPPAPYDSQFSGSPYDGEMAFLDENFGKLLEMLESRGVLENTIIAVVGDHGESLDEHSEPTHAYFVFDSTVRVPLLFAVPGSGIRPGTRVSSMVRTADIAPTLLDLLGMAPGPEMQGKTLVPLLENPKAPWSEEALVENYYNKFHFGWAPLRSLRTDDFKFIEAPRPELYDLRSDPDELVNLAPHQGQQVAEMRERMRRLTLQMESPDLGRSTAAQIDDETRQKLEAIGYLGGGSTESERAAPFPERDELVSMIDPKDQTLVVKYVNFVNEMLRAQKFDETLPVIHNALAIDPDNARLLIQLSRAMAGMNRWDKALEAVGRAQLLRPHDAEAYSIAGRIHVARGAYEEALEPLSQAVELSPQQVSGLKMLGGTYLALGRFDEAISHLETVLELDEENWSVMVDLANAYARTDRWEDARNALQRALEINPYSSTLRYRIAVFYRDIGEQDFSRRMLEESLRIAPDNVVANFELGDMLIAAGEGEAGRAYLARVVELAPQSAVALRATEILEGTLSN